MFLFLSLQILLLQKFANSREIVLYGYPTWVICVTKSENISSSATCVATFASDLTYDFAYYNSSEQSCCLTNYQYIFGAKNEGKTDVIGFRVDNSTLADAETCPEKNPLIYDNSNAGNANFRIEYSDNQLWISARACIGDIYVYYSIRNGKVVCWGLKQPNVQSSIGTISQEDPQFTSPLDLKIIQKEITDMIAEQNARKGAIPIDGKRKTECNEVMIMNNEACRFPNGYTFQDSENPLISQYQFVNKPDFNTEKQCIIMLFNLDDPSLDTRLTFVSCSVTSDDGYNWPYYIGRVL